MPRGVRVRVSPPALSRKQKRLSICSAFFVCFSKKGNAFSLLEVLFYFPLEKPWHAMDQQTPHHSLFTIHLCQMERGKPFPYRGFHFTFHIKVMACHDTTNSTTIHHLLFTIHFSHLTFHILHFTSYTIHYLPFTIHPNLLSLQSFLKKSTWFSS